MKKFELGCDGVVALNMYNKVFGLLGFSPDVVVDMDMYIMPQIEIGQTATFYVKMKVPSTGENIMLEVVIILHKTDHWVHNDHHYVVVTLGQGTKTFNIKATCEGGKVSCLEHDAHRALRVPYTREEFEEMIGFYRKLLGATTVAAA